MAPPANSDVIEALSAYDIRGEIGRGSWGVVLRAQHRQLGRDVAVKQLPVEFSSQAEVRRRFVNEARLLASLDHPHIVPVYDYIEKEGVCLLIMEYLPGGTVWSRFNTEGFDYIESVAIALATSAAMHFAHRHGVLHRDIKPENLMFTGSGILKVADFGIAKVLGAASTMGTRAGEVLGSPAYIAPEQATGSELGPYTDVYATAVVLYELLSGRLPFPDDGDPLMVMYRHVHEAPEPLEKVAPDVPAPIAQVVMYALTTNKEDRYQTAEEFGVALAEASTASFGPGWLRTSSIQVMGGGPIIAATERATFSLENIAPKRAGSGEGLVSESGMPTFATPPVAAGAQIPAQPSLQQAQFVDAMGQAASIPGAIPAAYSTPQTVIGSAATEEGNKRLASVFMLVALATALVSVALTFFGPSKPTPSAARSGGEASAISVQGNQVGRDPVTVDFDRPVDIRIRQPAGSASPPTGPSKLVATVSLPGGISVPVRSQLVTRDGDDVVYVFEGRQFKYLVAGKTTIRLRLETPDSFPADANPLRALTGSAIQVEPASKNLFAIPTIAAGLVLLAVFAYAEALILPMRRGKKRAGAVIGLGVLGLIAGVALGFLGWALGSVDPRVVVTGIGVVFFGAAGAAIGLWGYFSPPKTTLRPSGS
jgi:hypothetical protein